AAKALRNITQKTTKKKSTKDDSYPRLLVIDISLLFTVLPKESEILRIPERPYSYDNSINTVTDRWGQVVCFTELSASLILNQVRTAPKFSRTILALVGQTQEHGNGSWVLDVLDLLEVEKDVKASLCVHHIQLTDEDVLQAVIALRQRTGLTQDSIMYLTDNIEVRNKETIMYLNIEVRDKDSIMYLTGNIEVRVKTIMYLTGNIDVRVSYRNIETLKCILPAPLNDYINYLTGTID
ncbi:hypothetical protein AAMO2058_000250000, partial [Amorphochlora amoebiformis]